jgi:hypothetical protein
MAAHLDPRTVGEAYGRVVEIQLQMLKLIARLYREEERAFDKAQESMTPPPQVEAPGGGGGGGGSSEPVCLYVGPDSEYDSAVFQYGADPPLVPIP